MKIYLGNESFKISSFNVDLNVVSESKHLTTEQMSNLLEFLNSEGHPTVEIDKDTHIATISFTPFSEELLNDVKSSLNMDLRIAFLKRYHTPTRHRNSEHATSKIMLPISDYPLEDSQTTKNVGFTLMDLQALSCNQELILTENHLRNGMITINLDNLISPQNAPLQLDITKFCEDTKDNLPEGIPWKIYLHLGLAVISKGERVTKLFTNYDYVVYN